MRKAIRILAKTLLFTLATLLLLGAAGYVYLYVLPKGPDVSEVKPLEEGKDSFVMMAYTHNERKSIRVHTYKPSTWKDGDQLVMVMHGGGRNGDDYRDAWVELAEENNLLVVAPEFENKFAHITTNDYQEGNLFTFFGTANPKEEWAYTVVENIFDHVKSTNGITNDSYALFGHSAGGQFIHRMVMLMPEARISTAVAANAGFYTLPDDKLAFPYGMKNTDTEVAENLPNAYQKRLIVLLGELDNDPSLGTFRTTEQAMAQGGHRLARGSYFFQANQTLAQEKGWPLNWSIDTVPQVGHNYREMSAHAVKWLVE
ncbi:MAG TPA: hypothetical protein DCR93_34550 [Cytophagales bacterium]|nr:hypothetical protein [Cytophagales bacterium]HAP64391.1 hypothetical protein [Cytophagales bacterium]